jgi:hypothetical protein
LQKERRSDEANNLSGDWRRHSSQHRETVRQRQSEIDPDV